MGLTLDAVKENPTIQNYIIQTEAYLKALGYTDHGPRHVGIVADRARSLAKTIGLSAREQDLSAIAGYCHDMGNFLGRSFHHYWAAMLLSQVYSGQLANPEDLTLIMQAIVNHDKEDLKLVSRISAVLILADKSDVHRTRVNNHQPSNLFDDIHDRVNYAVTDNKFLVNRLRKEIVLKLKIDTKVSNPMEYFEIFAQRMTMCRQAAKRLGYRFVLVINNFKLS